MSIFVHMTTFSLPIKSGSQPEQFFRNTTFLSNISIEIIFINIQPFLLDIY